MKIKCAELILMAGMALPAGCKKSGDDAVNSAAPRVTSGQATNFTSVEYYPAPGQAQIKMRLSGAEGQPLPGGLLLIKQLEIETFSSNGNPQAVIAAPECLYDTLHDTASSAGHLRARSGDGKFSIEGDGFLWRQDDSFLTISNNVHTVIKTGAWKPIMQ